MRRYQFQYLITIEPLGLLYGSAGRFLSPDNLVGRSGDSFPPRAMALAGLFAHILGKDKLTNLTVAGAFWAKCNDVHNFYVPTPQTYLVDKEAKQVSDRLFCHKTKDETKWLTPAQIQKEKDKAAGKSGDEIAKHKDPEGKFETGTWMAIAEWGTTAPKIEINPWKFLPHLHPQLCADERRPYIEKRSDGTTKGGLFLENAVQLEPEVCLVYLSTEKLEDGWYRFGGEGHMVEVKCHDLSEANRELFNKPVGKSFALITPAVWGSNNFSHRVPGQQVNDTWQDAWEVEALLTDRPHPFRYRRGGHLSRGRYAVPAGTVYVLKEGLEPWHEWSEDWFPSDRDKPDPSKNEDPQTFKKLTLKNWGCGLALPLDVSNSEEAE